MALSWRSSREVAVEAGVSARWRAPSAPVVDASSPSTTASEPGWRRRIATGALMCAWIVIGLEATAVSSALPSVARDLGGARLASWVFSAFLVASTLAVPLAGRLADERGRRPVFVAGMLVFLLGSVLAGASRTMPVLIAWRAVQGVGAGGLIPLILTITADVYSLAERPRVQGLFTGSWGVANVTGPLVGGWLVAHASWRWVFLLPVPFGAVALALLAASYRDPARLVAAQRARLDALAIASFAAGAAALLFALDSGLALTWRLRIALLAIAVLSAAVCVRRHRERSNALFPAPLLAERAVRHGVVGSFFVGAILYALSAYLPLWLNEGRRTSAVVGGASLIPLLVGWAVGSTLGVRGLIRWGERAVARASMGAATAALVFLGTVAWGDGGLTLAFAGLGLVGSSLGSAASAWLVGPQMHVAHDARGAVTSAVQAARMFGGAIAVAALAIFPSSNQGTALRFLVLAAVSLLALAVSGDRRRGPSAPSPTDAQRGDLR